MLEVIASLQAAGIAVIAAAGNDGTPDIDHSGTFTLSSPAVSQQALSVASIESSHFQTGYSAKDSTGRAITYASLFPIVNGTFGLTVVSLGDGSRIQQQWCTDSTLYVASATGIEDFFKAALLIMRGGRYPIFNCR